MSEPYVVLITGASSGIGAETARLLVGRGYRVFGGAPDFAAEEDGFVHLPLDVTDEASVRACVEEVQAQAGGVDALINNAGLGLVGPLEETPVEQARLLLEVNLLGTARMVQAALPLLRARGGGRIINVGSAAGLAGVPYEGLYCASKAAVHSYTEALRLEVERFGVQVALVLPGLIATEFLRNARWTEGVLPAYAGVREGLPETYRRFWEGAAPPTVVARVIARLLGRRRMPLHNPAGGDAVWASRLLRVVPRSLVEQALRLRFRHLHREPAEAPLALPLPAEEPEA